MALSSIHNRRGFFSDYWLGTLLSGRGRDGARLTPAQARRTIDRLRRLLDTVLIAHDVSSDALALLTVRDARSALLDPGERHLWAHALGRTDAWLASTADAAAVHTAVRLGWEDRLVSLEELVESCAARSTAKKLNKQFRDEQLSKWRTVALLDRGLK